MKCDCCGTSQDLAGVACSALGPFSFSYCRSCAENYAEPREMVEGLIEELGFENIVPEITNSVTYFENGQYHKMSSLKPLPKGVSQ